MVNTIIRIIRRKLSKVSIQFLLALSFLLAYSGNISADVAEILQQIKSPRPLERLGALSQVANFSDPKLTSPVLSAIKDKDENVRLAAIAALHSLPSSQRVGNLLANQIMTEKSPRVRAKLACALARDYPASASSALMAWMSREIKRGRNVQQAMEYPIGPRVQGDADQSDDMDCRIAHDADEELQVILALLLQNSTEFNQPQILESLQDPSPQLRRIAAELVAASEPALATATIDKAVLDKDLAIVAGVHTRLIREGKSEYIPLLVGALNQYGTPEMASHYLSSGNQQLIDTAQQWASARGYRGYETAERPGLAWGRGGRKNAKF